MKRIAIVGVGLAGRPDRYANIGRQQGEDFFVDCDQQLAAAGDWCIHGRIESAYLGAWRLAQRLQPDL